MRESSKQTWLDRLCVSGAVSGAWPAPVLRWMRRHVAADATLRQQYDVLVRAEQASARRDVTRSQADSIASGLFDALDGVQSAAPSKNAALPRWLAVPVLGVAAALAVVVFVPSTPDDDLVARSVSTGALGMTVRCLEQGKNIRVVDEVAAGPGQSSSTLKCPSDGLLGFAFTNTTDADVHAFVIGVTTDDAVRWYAPFTKEASTVRVVKGSADEMLATAADLSQMAAGEHVVLRAVFFDGPAKGATLQSVIEQAAARRLSPSRLDRLPLRNTLEARVELVVEDRTNASRASSLNEPQ